METDMSLISLVSRASVLVQLVMLALLAASLLSWTIIFTKSKILKLAHDEAMRFEDQFWSGINLADLYSRQKKKDEERRGMARIWATSELPNLTLRNSFCIGLRTGPQSRLARLYQGPRNRGGMSHCRRWLA